MRYRPLKCPECGQIALGTYEMVPARAEFTVVDEATGEVDWEGTTEMFWDGQETQTLDGKPLLACYNGHIWPAVNVEESPLWDLKQELINDLVLDNIGADKLEKLFESDS